MTPRIEMARMYFVCRTACHRHLKELDATDIADILATREALLATPSPALRRMGKLLPPVLAVQGGAA